MASILMGIGVLFIKNILPISWQQVAMMIAAGLALYLLAIFMLEPKLVFLIKNQLKRK